MRGPRPHQGPDDPRISRPTPFGPRLRKAVAARNTFKGLRDRTSSGRLVLVPSDPLEQLNGALVRANPQKAEPRSCMVLGLKPMGKLRALALENANAISKENLTFATLKSSTSENGKGKYCKFFAILAIVQF